MAPNSLSPASVVLDYHSFLSPHKMTMLTKDWLPTNITGLLGSYVAWDLSTVDAETMIRDMCTRLAKFLPPTSSFDAATVYTMANATSPNIPQRRISLAIPGINASTNHSEAISMTWNFKTSANGNAKVVLLDVPILDSWFSKRLPASWTPEMGAIFDAMNGNGNAWAGRDNTRVNGIRSITVDLNDRLQKAYFK